MGAGVGDDHETREKHESGSHGVPTEHSDYTDEDRVLTTDGTDETDKTIRESVLSVVKK